MIGRAKDNIKTRVIAGGLLKEHKGINIPEARLEFGGISRKDIVVQKMIIKKCNRAGKFVITATQMLESMTENLRPTRAEVTDVANAILDGTDFVMLSAESAVGRYPVETVVMMNNIIKFTEKYSTRNLQ